jgi:hypothetical protein
VQKSAEVQNLIIINRDNLTSNQFYMLHTGTFSMIKTGVRGVLKIFPEKPKIYPFFSEIQTFSVTI